MASYTLIRSILQKAEYSDSNPGHYADLNEHLKSSTGFFSYSGGLGDDYKKVASSLSLNTSGLITAIDTVNIAAIAQRFLNDANRKKDKKLAYKAGVLFSLVAIYADSFAIKLEAYNTLSVLFQAEAYLSSGSLWEECYQRLTPIPLINTFYATDRIIWSWEIKGATDILAYETRRQEQFIKANTQALSIEGSFLILGLADTSNLSIKKINETCLLCKTRLKTIAGLSVLDARSNPQIQRFGEAERVLTHYIKFKEFNLKGPIKKLKERVEQLKNEEINQQEFNEMHKQIKSIELELNSMVRFAAVDHQFITDEMIQKRFGAIIKRYPQQNELHVMLQETAEKYWDCIKIKTDKLIAEAQFYTSMASNLTELEMEAVSQLSVKIEAAIHLLGQIKGDATEESSIMTLISSGHEIKTATLTLYLDRLRQKATEQVQSIKNEVKLIVALNQSLAKKNNTPADSMNTHRHILDNMIALKKINTLLSWLKGLNQRAKNIADAEFRTNIVSQTTPEQVAKSFNDALLHLSKEDYFRALDIIIGRQRNKNIQAEIALTQYLKLKAQKGDSFLNIVTMLCDMMNEQDLRFKIKAKDLVPEPSYITFDLAFAELEQNRVILTRLIKKLSEKANADVQSALEPILIKYDELIHDADEILREKNSLAFSWYERMTLFVKKHQEIKSSIEQIKKTLPNKTDGSSYLTSRVAQLIEQFNTKDAEFEQKFSFVNRSNNAAMLNSAKYNTLKSRISQERRTYARMGRHHQDRSDSLERLILQIELLDNNQTLSVAERFQSLLQHIHLEEMKTAKSHELIGFFGNWRPCRLQKMYLKILNEFAGFDRYSYVTASTVEELRHESRVASFR